jgi:hypothetical protein
MILHDNQSTIDRLMLDPDLNLRKSAIFQTAESVNTEALPEDYLHGNRSILG